MVPTRHCLVLLLMATAMAAEDTPRLAPDDLVRQATTQAAASHAIATTATGAELSCALQDLAGSVSADGLDLISTSEREGGGRVSVRVVGLGRTNGPLAPVGPGTVVIDERVVRLVRPTISEDISTSAGGIRQDFLVTARPAGTGSLMVSLGITGATVTPRKDGFDVRLPAGRLLAWHDLHVTDASGAVLAAAWVDGSDPAIRVDDADAVYPIRIDPTFTDADWLSTGVVPGAGDGVSAMTVFEGDLVVAGYFTAIGEYACNHVARWDGSAWLPFGAGIVADIVRIEALAVSGGSLYVGGQFTTYIPSVTSNEVMRWDGTAWIPIPALGSAIEGVMTLLDVGGVLYAGGKFVGPSPYLAAWDGAAWSSVGGGTDGPVKSLAWWNGRLYVGGTFATAGGVPAKNIASWDGWSWQALGTEVRATTTSPFFTDEGVEAMAADDGSLLVAGFFTEAVDGSGTGIPDTQNLARWDGAAWSGVSPVTLWALNSDELRALVVDDGDIYAASPFTVGKWDGNSWSLFGRAENVEALIYRNDTLYVAGRFETIRPVFNPTITPTIAVGIAAWDGSTWSPMAEGTGLTDDPRVALFADGRLYVGGYFDAAGGAVVNGAAVWDGSGWAGMGNGPGNTLAMAWDGSSLYVSAGNGLQRWDGTSWSVLSMTSYVSSLAWGEGKLYAAGSFNFINGTPASNIAVWESGSWSALGGGVNGHVTALAFKDGVLYAGGDFTQAGSTTAYHIASWDGND